MKEQISEIQRIIGSMETQISEFKKKYDELSDEQTILLNILVKYFDDKLKTSFELMSLQTKVKENAKNKNAERV